MSRPLATVVLPYRDWRLGNSLWLSAHFLSSALQHGFVIQDAGFSPYDAWYPRFDSPFVAVDPAEAARWQRRRRWLRRCPSGRFGPFAHINSLRPGFLALQRQQNAARGICHQSLDDAHWRRLVSGARTVVATDYFFRATELVLRHRQEIRRVLAPNASVIHQADAAMGEFAGQRVLGVHQRLGDYRTYQGGRYAFPNEVYAQWIEQAVTVLPQGEWSIAVFSDECAGMPAIASLSVRRMKGDAAIDLECLSRCDAILGPPSSFSLWAAWIKDVPLVQMMTQDQVIGAGDFHPVDPLRMP